MARALQRLVVDLEPVVRRSSRAIIARIGRLVAVVEAEPEPEPVATATSSRPPPRRADRRRALVLDHVARHQVAAVRGRVEHDVVRPPLEPAIEDGLQRLVARLVLVEAEVVAEDDEPRVLVRDDPHQPGQGLDVLARDLDQDQPLEPGSPSASTWACTALTSDSCPCRARPRAARCWRRARARTAACWRAGCRGRCRCP